jgi:hypothetical protein
MNRQTATVRTTPLTIDGLFVPGPAQGVAAVQNASTLGTGTALTNQEIMIRK